MAESVPTPDREEMVSGHQERRIYVCECGAVSDNPSMEKRVACGRRSDGWHDPKPVRVVPSPDREDKQPTAACQASSDALDTGRCGYTTGAEGKGYRCDREKGHLGTHRFSRPVHGDQGEKVRMVRKPGLRAPASAPEIHEPDQGEGERVTEEPGVGDTVDEWTTGKDRRLRWRGIYWVPADQHERELERAVANYQEDAEAWRRKANEQAIRAETAERERDRLLDGLETSRAYGEQLEANIQRVREWRKTWHYEIDKTAREELDSLLSQESETK